MMKIALVSLQHDAERVPPIGLDYIATYLEKTLGINNMRIIDANFEDVEKETIDYKPDIICLTAMSYYYSQAVDFAKKMRQNLPEAFIVIGGVHISTFPDAFDGEAFDMGAVGQRGEESIAIVVKNFMENGPCSGELIKSFKGIVYQDKNTKEIIQTVSLEPLDNIDQLPFPEFRYVNQEYMKPELIPHVGEVVTRGFIFTNRSCPYRCIFCSTVKFWGKFRIHSIEYVVRNIRYLYDKYNARHMSILDDLFVFNKKRIRELIAGLEKEGLLGKVTFEGNGRAHLMDDEFCGLLNKLNLKMINFGFESGSDRVLDKLKVGSATVETNKRSIVTCSKYDISVYGSLMFGSPGEKIEDMEKTVEFIDFATKNGAARLWSFIATPFPFTEFWEIAKKKGTVSSDMDTSALSHHTERPLLLDDDVGTEEFFKVYNKGKKLLRKFNYNLILRFAKKHPFKAVSLVVSEPNYWVTRLYRQLYAQ